MLIFTFDLFDVLLPSLFQRFSVYFLFRLFHIPPPVHIPHTQTTARILPGMAKKILIFGDRETKPCGESRWDRACMCAPSGAKSWLRNPSDSVRQQLPNHRTYLSGEDLRSLAVEMDVVAMEFRMPAHRGVEIDSRDFPCRCYLRGH